MKKFLSILLACVLLCCTIPTVFAEERKGTRIQTGEELQALIDKASPGDELYVLIDTTTNYNSCVFSKSIVINKKLKIHFDVYDQTFRYFDMESAVGSAFLITADDVELYFSDKVWMGGPQDNTTYGESIYVKGKNCLIDNGHFHYCGRANNDTWGYNDYDGGAIYVDATGCTIQNSYFEYCFGYDGGAICVNQHNCHVINCSFNECTAVDYGGAIYVCTGTKGFVASHCTFSECSAVDYAHYISGARNAKVYDCNPHWGEEDYYSKWVTFETSDPLANPSGFTLSEGNVWIIAGIGVVAVVALAVVVAKKKKNPALAEGEVAVEENTEKTEE